MHHLGLSENWVTILSVVALFTKIFGFIYILLYVGKMDRTPRFRYATQLMDLGWKVLIPLAIANIIITGLVVNFFK